MNAEEVIEQMIKKGYGSNFMNGDLVVAMVRDILKITNPERQLFIGKVSDLIGFEKTIELLKESKREIK